MKECKEIATEFCRLRYKTDIGEEGDKLKKALRKWGQGFFQTTAKRRRKAAKEILTKGELKFR